MSTGPGGYSVGWLADVLAQAGRDATRSGYFDCEDLPDTGSYIGALLHGPVARSAADVRIELTASSLSLRETPKEESEFAALNSVRSQLRAQVKEPSVAGITTIFGKTITAVRTDLPGHGTRKKHVDSTRWPGAGMGVDIQGSTASAKFTLGGMMQPQLAADQAMYAGWAAAVMSSLARRVRTSPSEGASITPAQLLRPVFPHEPDQVLKAFTAPTWRIDPGYLLVQNDLSLARSGLDLHFPSLRSERSFRSDLRDLGNFSGCYLLVTDVHGLFSRRVGDRWPVGSSSLFERLSPAYGEYLSGRSSLSDFLRFAYLQRLALAQDLRATLLAIADSPGIERASFTRGDGIAAITRARAHLDTGLGPDAPFRKTYLPFSVGACRILAGESAEDTLKRAEFALAVTKLCTVDPERSIYIYGDGVSQNCAAALQAHLARHAFIASSPENKIARLVKRHREMLARLAGEFGDPLDNGLR
jgi:hypothetical protein